MAERAQQATAARRFERYRQEERAMEFRRLRVYRSRRRWLDKSLRELLGFGKASDSRLK
jgi:hypothetical protein